MDTDKLVLVLNSWYAPHRIIRWQNAVIGIYKDTLDIVEEYSETISSPSVIWACPAVVRLKRKLPKKKRSVRFSRSSIFLRDKYMCQYCCSKPGVEELTMDHVVPKSHGGKTNWKNIVTACKLCNGKKGSKSCEDVNMFPKNIPAEPKALPIQYYLGFSDPPPEQWLPYLTKNIFT